MAKAAFTKDLTAIIARVHPQMGELRLAALTYDLPDRFGRGTYDKLKKDLVALQTILKPAQAHLASYDTFFEKQKTKLTPGLKSARQDFSSIVGFATRLERDLSDALEVMWEILPFLAKMDA